MIACRVRMRFVDKNGQYGSFILPCAEDTGEGAAEAIKNQYEAITATVVRELDIINVVARYEGAAGDGDTPLVNDIAVLVFSSDGPFGLKVPIAGPADIFLEDDVSVDMDNIFIVELVSLILEHGRDRAGNELVECLGGKRTGAGGP